MNHTIILFKKLFQVFSKGGGGVAALNLDSFFGVDLISNISPRGLFPKVVIIKN
jgi:hypothetical protein